MSPRLFENRLWGFQSQFFFAWVFPVIASWCLFRVERRPALMVGAAAALVLGAYSFAGGLVMSLVVTCVYVVFAAGRWIQGDKRTLPTAAVLVLLPVAAGISWWLLQYSKPAWHPQPATPWEWRFWPFFVNLVDSGFGIDQLGVERGFFFTTILALPFAGLLWRDRGRFEPATWALGAVALGLFGFLASVTMGRAPFHLADSKTSRYIEVSALLIPLAAGAYWLLLKEWPLWRRRTLVAFWLLTLGSIYDNWSFERYFEPISTRNQRGRDCIAQYYAVGGDGLCAEIYPRPLKHQLDTAQRLGISFAKDLARPASSQP
jgi:hypothetical protein